MMDEQQLTALLEQSRDRNLRQNVTGMLIYCDGNFFQVLEGEEKDVKEIYHSISCDSRNNGNIVLIESQIVRRNFPEWSMGFKVLCRNDLMGVAGFSEFLVRNMDFDEFAFYRDAVVELLYSFKNSNTCLGSSNGSRGHISCTCSASF